MFKFITKKLTKKFTRVPLFTIYLNFVKFKLEGKQNSCVASIHPRLREDKHIEKTLKGLIDYVRDNYDMDEIV